MSWEFIRQKKIFRNKILNYTDFDIFKQVRYSFDQQVDFDQTWSQQSKDTPFKNPTLGFYFTTNAREKSNSRTILLVSSQAPCERD